MCFACVYVGTAHLLLGGCPQRSEVGVNLPGTRVKMVVNYHMGAGIRTKVLCKTKKTLTTKPSLRL